MKNDASMALSYPQNRTARRVWSYERLWLGKSITWSPPITSSPVHHSGWSRNQRAFIVEYALQRPLGGDGNLTIEFQEKLH